MVTIILFIAVFGLAYWYFVPKYKTMVNLLVLRSKVLLEDGVTTVYLLRPQQGTVVSRVPNIGNLVPKLNAVIAYVLNGQLILEAAIGQKLRAWGTYTAADVPKLDPTKRSIRLGDRTFLVLSTDPEKFADFTLDSALPLRASRCSTASSFMMK